VVWAIHGRFGSPPLQFSPVKGEKIGKNSPLSRWRESDWEASVNSVKEIKESENVEQQRNL
jgi:hypothetical protein